MQIAEQIKQTSDATAGAIFTGIGAGGAVVQTVTEWGNLLVMFGNIVLVVGGCYLMFHKIIDRRRNRRQSDAK